MTEQKASVPVSIPANISRLSPLVQAAMDGNLDTEKLRELLAIQKEYEANEARKAFSAAMSACQSEMPAIVKNAENKQTNSMYAKHELICQLIKPVYTRHGLSLSFHEGKAERDGEVRVVCDVDHEMGHSKQYFVDLPRDDKGIKGTVNKTPVHAKASTFQYGRRYLTLMIFDLATYDDNDAAFVELITEEQANEIHSKITDNELNLARFLTWLRKEIKVDKIEAIPVRALDTVMTQIDAVIKAKKK